MKTYAVYEIIKLFNGKLDMKKIDTVKATNSDTAIYKAMLGRNKKYKNMRAFQY